jgi:hypothetical protein
LKKWRKVEREKGKGKREKLKVEREKYIEVKD